MSVEGSGRGDLAIEDIVHSYGATTVLKGVSLDVPEGEFLTLLGPSGCGKTTLLRIIAGLIEPTAGAVRLGELDLLASPAHHRPVNTVFQRATLFPHLDVFGNVAFGLGLRKVKKADVAARVRAALAMVRLEGYEKRKAGELSGGQMQRIALARALVLEPRVLLLDEPLSALDLKIKLEMEVALRRVHRETGATFIYVTHDQREALALSDRIVIMNEGHIEQVGPAAELYRNPATAFAAQFVGNANVLPVQVGRGTAGSALVSLGAFNFDLPSGSSDLNGGAWLVVRPESVRLAADNADALLSGVVRDVSFRGTAFGYRLEVDGLDRELRLELPLTEKADQFPVGEVIHIKWDPQSCQLMSRDPGVANEGRSAAPA